MECDVRVALNPLEVAAHSFVQLVFETVGRADVGIQNASLIEARSTVA